MSRLGRLFLMFAVTAPLAYACTGDTSNRHQLDLLNKQYAAGAEWSDHKLVIYQTLVRHFGNTNTTNKPYGSIAENGVGKFNDYTKEALAALRDFGITHVWYTGVIEHATMTDYSAYGILPDDPDIVKGRAGSPYAIRDYYDVAPDLAVDVLRRMEEFEALVQRTHQAGLKAIIDFVPNHVARTYHSDAKPEGVRDFGADDDVQQAFSPTNDYYYIPGTALVIPKGYHAGGPDFHSPLKDGKFEEYPAKVTGNNVFSATPSLDDWSETVKLNYGIDVQGGEKEFFDPIPPVWTKTRDIILFWAGKGVDGFRCDVAEMVPVAYWNWLITQVKNEYPEVIFIAEAYDPQQYHNFLENGRFDYLYDKVGLYDGLKKLMRNEADATADVIRYVWQEESRGFSDRMLRFLENHDEHRVASSHFAGDPWLAVPAMVVSATLSSGPVMIYSGQEVGEPGLGDEGYGGDDGRTSIFDYWGVPHHQRWMNNGAFDGGALSEDERALRAFYQELLNLLQQEESLASGGFYDLTAAQSQVDNASSDRIYAYIRYTESERVLIVVNFDRESQDVQLLLPEDLRDAFGLSDGDLRFDDLLGAQEAFVKYNDKQVSLQMAGSSARILKF